MKHRQATVSVYGLFGEQLQRRVDRELIDRFVERVIESGGTEARIAWERTGVLGTKLVAPLLPPRLPKPRSVFLRSPLRFRTGLTLQVEFSEAVTLPTYVDDLVEAFAGHEPVPEFVPEEEGSETLLVPEPEPAPPPVTPVRHRAADPVSPAAPAVGDDAESHPADLAAHARRGQPVPAAEPVPVEQPAPPPSEPEPVPEVEVLPPPQARAQRAREEEEQAEAPYGAGDPFGLPFTPNEVMLGESLRIVEEDLPWLNPGDRVVSERRGACRITHVEEDNRQVLMRNAQGELLIITADELLDEFRFDESFHGG